MSQCFDSVHYSIYLVKVGLGPCQRGHLAYINKLGYLGLRMSIQIYLSIYLSINLFTYFYMHMNIGKHKYELLCSLSEDLRKTEQSMIEQGSRMQERFLHTRRGAAWTPKHQLNFLSLASADQFKWKRTTSRSSVVWQCIRDWVGGRRAHTGRKRRTAKVGFKRL